MKAPSIDRVVLAGAGVLVFGCLGTLVWLVPAGSVWPLVEAFCGVGAALVCLGWLVPGPWTSWLWGLGSAALLVAESAWEYDALPESALPFQAAAWIVAALVLGASGALSEGGWKAGLRAGVAGQLAVSVGWGALLVAFFQAPLQTAVLDAGGALTRFQQSSAVSFWSWVADDYWAGVLGRLLVGAGLGAGAGWVGSWIKGRFRPKS